MATLNDPFSERDEAKETAVRGVFLAYLKKFCGVELAFDAAAASLDHPQNELYIGSHECKQGLDNLELYVELWAFYDDHPGESDFLGWHLVCDDSDRGNICYCPMCGVDLEKMIGNRDD